MKKEILAVFDHDVTYAKCFFKYLLKYKKINMDVVLFTSFGQLVHYMEDTSIEALVISEEASKLLPENDIKELIILGEDQAEEAYIYKYQSAEKILEIIEERMQKKLQVKVIDEPVKKVGDSRLVGIYSPGEGASCIMLTMALAKAIGERKKILILDCECFSGFPVENDHESYYSMSDLVYYAKNKQEEMWEQIKEKLYHMEDCDVLMPVQYYSDLLELTKEDVEYFIKQISKNSIYDLIFICIDFFADFSEELLELCGQVLMPTTTSVYMKNKEAAFYQMLKLEGKEEELKKYQSVQIPAQILAVPDATAYSQDREVIRVLHSMNLV